MPLIVSLLEVATLPPNESRLLQCPPDRGGKACSLAFGDSRNTPPGQPLARLSPHHRAVLTQLRSQQRKPLTRFGTYKIAKRHTATLVCSALGQEHHGLNPHAFRHSWAVHLLEAASRSMSSGHGCAMSASIPPIATLRSRCVPSRPQSSLENVPG
jgi:integrase